MRLAATVHHFEKPIRWVSWMVIAAGVAQLFRALPAQQIVTDMHAWATDLGAWAPVIFGIGLVVGALLLVPTVALTLPAGATFGPWVGALTISLATTLAAAVAFIIARSLARQRLLAACEDDARFAAVDSAVGTSGWKLIALFRLSLAVPFGLSNYAFGLSSVRFVPYLITTWISMLPACLLYGWLGHLGSTGLAGGALDGSPWQFVVLAVGLLATALATVYAHRLFRVALSSVPAAARTAEPMVPSWRVLATAGLALAIAASGIAFGPRIGVAAEVTAAIETASAGDGRSNMEGERL